MVHHTQIVTAEPSHLSSDSQLSKKYLLQIFCGLVAKTTTTMRSTIAIVFLHTIATSAPVAAAVVVPCIPCINRQDVKIGVVHHGVLSTDGAYWVSYR